jgi:hypothetical protein
VAELQSSPLQAQTDGEQCHDLMVSEAWCLDASSDGFVCPRRSPDLSIDMTVEVTAFEATVCGRRAERR